MSLRRLLFISAISLAVVGATYAQNQRPDGRPVPPDRAAQQKRQKQFANKFIMRYGIQLTDAQKAQIKQIGTQGAPNPSLVKELRTIMGYRKNGPLSEAQKARAKDIQQQMQTKKKTTREQVLNVYTPEQKAQMQKNREDLQRLQKDIRQLRQQFRQDHPLKLGLKPQIKAGLN